ncbi:allophanate hydrolase, partial [Lactobacillus crispatus]
LEVNTRLQVEHPVTEAVFGVDLVEWMVRQAAGEDVLAGARDLVSKGAAIEARVYAENPNAGFRPSAGRLTCVAFPDEARIDGWIETGVEVTPFYDPMLAKVIVAADTRSEAITKLQRALADTTIAGIETNLDYLRAIAASDVFHQGRVATNVLG